MQVFFGKKHLGLKISETSEISWGSDLFVKIGNHKTTMHLRPLQFKNTPNKAIEYPHVHEEIHLQVISLFSLLSSFAVVFHYYTTTPAAKKNMGILDEYRFPKLQRLDFFESRFQEKNKNTTYQGTNKLFQNWSIYIFLCIYWKWMIIWNSSAYWNLSLRPKKKCWLYVSNVHKPWTNPCPLVHEGVLNVFYNPEVKSPESWQVTVHVVCSKTSYHPKGPYLQL